jgi:DNA-binding MarR family transcriptional regulator
MRPDSIAIHCGTDIRHPSTASGRRRTMPKIAVISELIEHLSRQIQGASYAHDLKPAQWSALRYYARALKTARTIRAFAAVHASSHSAASQIVTGLKRKRLLTSYRAKHDGREQVVEVTPAGAKLLRHDPLRLVSAALKALSESERRALQKALDRLLVAAFDKQSNN